MAKKTTNKIEVASVDSVEVASVDNKAAKLPKMPLGLAEMQVIAGIIKSYRASDSSKFGGLFVKVENMRRVEWFGDKIYSFVESPAIWGLIVDTDSKTRNTTAIIPYDGKKVAITMPHNTGKKPVHELVKAGFKGEDTWGYNPAFLRKIVSYIADDKSMVALITFNHIIENNFGFPVGFYTREDERQLKREFPEVLDFYSAGIDTKADIKIDYREVKAALEYIGKLKDILLDDNKTANQKTAAKSMLTEIGA